MSLRRPTGRAAFAGDIAMPGLLQLVLRRSSHARARVRSVDVSQAATLPGIVAILTSENAPRLIPPDLRFFGDRLLVAAGEELESARRAAEMVAIEIEPLPAVLDPVQAAQDDSRVAARLSQAVGDVDRTLLDADDVIEGEWRLPFGPALSLEPPQVVTWLDEDRRLVVRTSAESLYRVRTLLAERLGLPAAGIRVVRPLVAGGAEGAAGASVEDLCAAVTLRTGRPARLVLQGDDQLVTAPGRPAQRVRVRIGLRKGRISALDLRLLVDLGASRERGAERLRASARHALCLYGAPALRIEAVAVCTDKPPAGAPRGSDRAAAFAVECAVDEAARRCGVDPALFRLSHLRKASDAGNTSLAALGERSGSDDSAPLAALLTALADPAGEGPDSLQTAPAWRRGLGVALARGSPDAAAGAGPAASLHLLDDGSFALTTGAGATGGADEGAYAQAAAAILTVPASRIVCAAVDTDSAAFEAGESSSAAGDANLAVEQVARLAREQIREAAARLLQVPPSETSVEAGHVRDGAGRRISFAAVGSAAVRAGQPLVVTAAPAAAAAPTSLAAARAAVEVDIETGQLRVTGLDVALPARAEPDTRACSGIVEGALASAIEQALACGQGFDADGRPLVRSLRDWPLVAATDVPPLSVSFVDCGGAVARVSEAALAEVATGAALAAITNAAARATRARFSELPLTPPVVLDSL